jgi:hypothetical protein
MIGAFLTMTAAIYLVLAAITLALALDPRQPLLRQLGLLAAGLWALIISFTAMQ